MCVYESLLNLVLETSTKNHKFVLFFNQTSLAFFFKSSCSDFSSPCNISLKTKLGLFSFISSKDELKFSNSPLFRHFNKNKENHILEF